MDLSIIIVNFNTKDLLKDCLSSILRQTKGINFEVLVIDNASIDGSAEMVKEFIKPQASPASPSRPRFDSVEDGSARRWRANIKLIQNKKNLGFAKANNQAIKEAKGKYFLLLNSDTLLKDNALLKLIKFAKNHPQAGVIGCRLLNKDGSPQPSVAPFFTLPWVFLWLLTGDRFLYSSPPKTCQVDWVMGAALMAKKEAIEKAGLLDEKFFMYVEEVEWCYRIKKADWEVWFYPEAKIFHLVRGSSPEGKQKAILGIYQGLIWFYQKHFAPWQLPVLKFLLRTKAAGAWFIGILTGNHYLRQTYAKAFKLACHV